MSTLGDIPVPVTLTRDQVRMIRGLITAHASTYDWVHMGSDALSILDTAEDNATIMHAKGYSHFDLWE